MTAEVNFNLECRPARQMSLSVTFLLSAAVLSQQHIFVWNDTINGASNHFSSHSWNIKQASAIVIPQTTLGQLGMMQINYPPCYLGQFGPREPVNLRQHKICTMLHRIGMFNQISKTGSATSCLMNILLFWEDSLRCAESSSKLFTENWLNEPPYKPYKWATQS